MENNQDLKDFAKMALKGVSGLVQFAEAQAKKSLEELKTKDPKLAEEKAREFANAMNSGNMNEGFAKLKKDIEAMDGIFNGH